MIGKIYEASRRTGFIILLVGLGVIGLGVWGIESANPLGTLGLLALPVGVVIVFTGLVIVIFN